jgi:hypothetical protein
MKQSASLRVSIATVCLLCSAALPAGESGVPAFPDASGPELWIDGPDAVQLGTSSGNPDVAVSNDGTRIHGWYGRLSTPWDSLTWDGEPEPDNINGQFIIGRDIEHCMFCDDFEWFSPGSPGSLWRWSATAGVVP